ncbi:aldo/keto reductase, partial [Sulfitobacter sp. S45]|uniref:aldo/keto reductase n=1 Tax=Sulfitobacter sp. S45 TaxID=3368581 RepID=UPI003746E620
MAMFPTRPIADTDLHLPVLGLGTVPIAGRYENIPVSQARGTLDTAYRLGIRHFDCSPYYGYGLAERYVGDCLRYRPYILSTKVGRRLLPGAEPYRHNPIWQKPLPFHPVFDYSYNGIMRSFEDSLQRLGLDRIDFLLVHDIDVAYEQSKKHAVDLLNDGYRALTTLKNSGHIK